MKSSTKYFLYRNAPFRILYDSGNGFCEPPRDNSGPKLRTWWFQDFETARLMAKANTNRDVTTHVGDSYDFKKLGGREYTSQPSYSRTVIAQSRPPRYTPQRNVSPGARRRETSLEDLI